MANTRILQETALRYFLEVVRSGSITEAAAKLNVASSAISRQIARLEDELDTPLFDRHARGMVPNAAGELLAAYALRVQLDTDRIGNELMALKGLRRGEVKLACTEGFAVDFLPRLIDDFRRRHDGIHFHLAVDSSSNVNRLVHGGEVDIGLTFTLAPARGVKVEFSQSAPILAVMSISHPLAGKRRLALSELAAYPMALPAKRIAMRQLIDACCSRKNLMIEPVLTSDSIDAILTFVTLGGGIAFSAELPIRRLIEQGRIAAVSIQDPDMNALQLQVQTLEGRILPQAARVFLDTLVAAIPPAASTPKS